MNTTDKRHTFHLCIEEDETTTLDIMVRAGDTPEDITKAKKTILKMLADYTPAAKKAAPVPPAEVEAPAAPGPEEEARASAPDAGAQMPPESDAPPQGSGALEQKTLEGVRGLLRLRCPECGSMKRPEKIPPLIKGSIATPSLIAGIMNAKYVNGMPLARQEREFARYGLNLSTKTMANWIISCADRYLKLLYGRMKEEFLKSRYIHCDETRIQVIGEPDQKGSTQNWMWVYLTDEYSGSPQMALFDYERTRAGYHPVKFLDGRFHGYLTCDGYQAYHGLDDSITVTGCLTHARRRFDAALTALKKDFTKEQLKETVAYQAMARIGILYKVEELIKNKTPEERYEERQKQSRPVVDALFEWLHSMEDSVDRSSLIGDAILYTINQEMYLRRYLEDGRLSIDNNSAERAIKNFAVGRRNWLFARSIRGADASAVVYSITETALLNGLKPYVYLTYILDQLRQMGPFPKPEELDRLLPWSDDLPDGFRTKNQG